ncbi:UNVERIFIED_ORG: hypothetical protein J2Y77_004988 [Pseudomonas lini]|uniref:Uncharacterized protein n=1 Tax=Pseudomonas viciae TaxID=2505979 RepID=A0ABY8PEN8_9PSED|nr:hypothetical protein [Pseudomonas viciae]UZE86686.1 hypothetical protein LOY66_00915 [Pseudomonas viciae]WGO93643.1 hypothetical protein QCD61_00795 [Pseudomonas viciae]
MNKGERIVDFFLKHLSWITAKRGAASDDGNRNNRMSESSKQELEHAPKEQVAA